MCRSDSTLALAYLGIEVPTPTAVANASGPSLIGVRFNGLYKELWINWGSTFARMTVARDIFVNTVDTAIGVTNFVTGDPKIVGWVNAAGSALFCRVGRRSACLIGSHVLASHTQYFRPSCRAIRIEPEENWS